MEISNNFYTLFHLSVFFFTLYSCEFDIVMRNCHIPRTIIEIKSSKIRVWSIDDSFSLIQNSSFLSFLTNLFSYVSSASKLFLSCLVLFFLFLNCSLRFLLSIVIIFFVLRTWIIQDFNIADLKVSQSYKMNLSINSVTSTTNISTKCNINLVIFFIVTIFDCLPTISDYIRMAASPWK